MALDLTLPKDGITNFGELYSKLRDNFNGLWNPLVLPNWTYVVTYGTGWTPAAGFECAYMKDAYGIVHLRGRPYNGSTSYIFQLPTGYRPGHIRYYPVGIDSGSYIRILNIDTNGYVNHEPSYPAAYYHLASVSFMAGA